MDVLLANLWRIGFMVVLLCCSAFCSGSETAFFNVSRREQRSFRTSANKLQQMAGWLLQHPERLLTTLLLGNMLVNVLFFSLASVLTVNLNDKAGHAVAVIVATISFFAVLLLGEMLPKSIAYSRSHSIVLWATPMWFVAVRILGPVLHFMQVWIVAPLLRLLLGSPNPASSQAATVDQLKSLLNASRQQGLLSEPESRLMSEVLEFGMLRARHVMVPRVDMILCDVTDTPDAIRRRMQDRCLDIVPIYENRTDNVIGLLHLRDLLRHSESPIRSLLHTAVFVPEQKTVESLFAYFRKTHDDVVLVVDEYGGIVGLIREDDIIDQLFGSSPSGHLTKPVEQLGPLTYRLSGDLPIHDWAVLFGIDPGELRVTTVGGLTVALLGRLPKAGDILSLDTIEIRVEQVSRHRVDSIVITFRSLSSREK
ncbi:MAG: HlyC/CorC family transporter [Sedimentisphaerales bacterium]|nr:HlyC/CorC family transporter [Sedimentisphaerales bacterium]